jgi:hypothetical protein
MADDAVARYLAASEANDIDALMATEARCAPGRDDPGAAPLRLSRAAYRVWA